MLLVAGFLPYGRSFYEMEIFLFSQLSLTRGLSAWRYSGCRRFHSTLRTVPTFTALMTFMVAHSWTCYFLLSITPRHRLPVINSQSFRNLGIFSESEVRVFKRTSRVKISAIESLSRVIVISAGIYQFQTGITQGDRSPR
jgi:hypothetical protein